jgi:ATP adenylyltransferase
MDEEKIDFVEGGVGIPDQWNRIWTPHRMAYIMGENRPSDSEPGDGCPFCAIVAKDDSTALIIKRGVHAYVVLNLYPYNAGHVLICTYRHVADFTDLTTDESAEIVALTQSAMRTLRACSGARGFNLGLNQGAISGAGIEGHLHQHVVPRWGGDSNFMPIIGRTKPMPALLSQTRDLLASQWID